METLLLISLSILWGVVLVNLMLTLRVVRWVRATNEARAQQQAPEVRPELVVGAPAPDFKARTLAGQPVRLDDYAGRAVAFMFSSPSCGHCRREMPMLAKLAPLAQKNGGVELIIVSDSNAAATQTWLESIRREDGLDVPLSVLVAPYNVSDFLADYNPNGLFPSFCLIDEHGLVQAHGPVGKAEWSKLKRSWEGVTKVAPWMVQPYR